MADRATAFGANRLSSTLFIPIADRDGESIDQEYWVAESLRVLGECFGGATAFPQGRGVWRDDARGGVLVYDEPVVVQCYTSETLIEERAEALRSFLVRMGTESGQGAVGMVIDREYLEIGFPLEERGS